MSKYLLHASYSSEGSKGLLNLPDHASAAAASLAIAGTGALNGKMTVLLTPEDIDQASRKSPSYTPPGR